MLEVEVYQVVSPEYTVPNENIEMALTVHTKACGPFLDMGRAVWLHRDNLVDNCFSMM